MTGRMILVTDNPVVQRKLARAAATAERTFEAVTDLAAIGDAEPDAVVVDLDRPGALDAPRELRSRWQRALLAAFISVPDRERWEQARSAGYDLVATRGAIAGALTEKLATWTGPRARRRIRLVDEADTAGRLGCVRVVEDTPVGDVAVFHIGKRLYAVEGTCPHAGASLCSGELDEAVVTCPLHGSRFDVRTGARVRGPADRELATFDVVVEDGVVFMEVPAGEDEG